MKNKITLHLAMFIAFIEATLARAFGAPDCVALGNADEPNDPPAQQQQQQQQPETSAEKKLKQLARDDREIKRMKEAGLTHEQATAAIGHKNKFSAGFEKWEKSREQRTE